MNELDLTSSEKKATYQQIKDYILDKHGLKVSTLYISQIKRKSGLEVGENYNVSKKENKKYQSVQRKKKMLLWMH